MVSALWLSLGTGDTQGVTLAEQCHQCPAGVSGPGGGTSPRGCAPLCPTPGLYLWRGLPMAAATSPSAGTGLLGRRELQDGRGG